MAEFCLECYRKFCQPEDVTEAVVTLSGETELCEGCGEFKQVVEDVVEPVPELPPEVHQELRDKAESFGLGLERAFFDRAGHFQEKTAVHYITADWTSEAEKKGAALLLRIYKQKIRVLK